MIHDDIQALLCVAPHRPLAGLEAAIWRGVAERSAADRRILTMGSLQSGALVLALIISLSWGAKSARSRDEPHRLEVFSPRIFLAPSTRLIGADG